MLTEIWQIGLHIKAAVAEQTLRRKIEQFALLINNKEFRELGLGLVMVRQILAKRHVFHVDN